MMGTTLMTAGEGLFVGWYDTDPTFQPELDCWHSQEHMPERVDLPGFLTGQRYTALDKNSRYCVLYRAVDVQTFVSGPYLNVLNNPTDWTRRMMRGIRNLNRSLCSAVRDSGAGFGRTLHTIQFSPDSNSEAKLISWLDEAVTSQVLAERGAVRLSLAIADRAISQTKTAEQDLREGHDTVSDWILLFESYLDAPGDTVWTEGLLSSESLESHGGRNPVGQTFALSHLLVSRREKSSS
jgi:hypothetical protein